MSKKKHKSHKKSQMAKKTTETGDSKELKSVVSSQDEQVLDLEAAKTLTVEEASQKQAEMAAGVSQDDSLLDRYIKQHREAIEAEKFETKQYQEALIKEELANSSADQSVEPISPEHQELSDETTDTISFTPVQDPVTEPPTEVRAETTVTKEPAEEAPWWEETETEAKTPFFKQKSLWFTLLALLGLLAIVWTVYSHIKQGDSNKEIGRQSSTSSSSSRRTSSSSSSENLALKEFDALYASFFTDDQQRSLKNESFGQLASLETALAALEGTSDYEAAKDRFDKLKVAIEAIEAINQQFDKPILVDGTVDTSATVKADATFNSSATGLAGVDADLTSAINFGRSQLERQVAADNPVPIGGDAPASGGIASSPAPSGPAAPSNSVTLSNGVVLNYSKRVVYGSDTVELQRHLSRVPYDDAAIARVDDPAWIFEEHVLERIIATSNQRGYFAGNEFILEKVNIINGRGYYNLFKTDGTYLFSINAKTGYFVGNGSGYADSLDF